MLINSHTRSCHCFHTTARVYVNKADPPFFSLFVCVFNHTTTQHFFFFSFDFVSLNVHSLGKSRVWHFSLFGGSAICMRMEWNGIGCHCECECECIVSRSFNNGFNKQTDFNQTNMRKWVIFRDKDHCQCYSVYLDQSDLFFKFSFSFSLVFSTSTSSICTCGFFRSFFFLLSIQTNWQILQQFHIFIKSNASRMCSHSHSQTRT